MTMDEEIKQNEDAIFAESLRLQKMILSLQDGIKMILEKMLNRKVELEYNESLKEYKWKI